MRILVLGDSCIDRHVIGEVVKVNPEYPSLVLAPASTIDTPGMAANVFRCFQALAEPSWEVDLLTHSNQIVKTRYVEKASGAILLRVDEGDKVDIPATMEGIPAYTDYIISDYGKGFVTKDLIRRLSLKGRVWLDSKLVLNRFAEHVFCVKINAREYAHNMANGADVNYLANMVVTRGGDGAERWVHGGLRKRYPGQKVEVSSVAGCGDTFLAALAAEYIRTDDWDVAIEYANRAAAIAASKPGVVVVTKDEMR